MEEKLKQIFRECNLSLDPQLCSMKDYDNYINKVEEMIKDERNETIKQCAFRISEVEKKKHQGQSYICTGKDFMNLATKLKHNTEYEIIIREAKGK